MSLCCLEVHTLTLCVEGTFNCMKAAYDCGINFFDCAEGYAGGESEKVMGQAIKKFGYSYTLEYSPDYIG